MEDFLPETNHIRACSKTQSQNADLLWMLPTATMVDSFVPTGGYVMLSV